MLTINVHHMPTSDASTHPRPLRLIAKMKEAADAILAVIKVFVFDEAETNMSQLSVLESRDH